MSLDAHQKEVIRKALAETARGCLGIPYKWGAEVTDMGKQPEYLDCSEKNEFVFRKNGLSCPDGCANQFAFFVPALLPKVGDIGFFIESTDTHPDRKKGDAYHTGMIVDSFFVAEARALDLKCKFATGKVILRPRINWEKFENFGGWRSHPDLA